MSVWSYPLSVETGYFRSPRTVVDPGEFTMTSADVPLRTMRRKPLTLASKSRTTWKKARLTPIHENDEINQISSSLDGVRSDVGNVIKNRLRGTEENNDVEMKPKKDKAGIDRSDTPVTIRKPRRVLSKLDDVVEDELANILEGESDVYLRDPEVRQRLSELPPRPRCKRKVLPPSVTNSSDTKHGTSKVKVLRVRQKLEHSLDPLHKSSMKKTTMKNDVKPDYNKNASPIIARKTNTRRKAHDSDVNASSENDVCVLTLDDLKEINKVNDIMCMNGGEVSSAVSKLVKPDEDRSSDSSIMEDDGSRSTSRFTQPMQEDILDDKRLKGSDLTPFYNMWDRDHSRRPFGRKDPGKLSLYRSCMCALKSPTNRNCRAHHLPPL